MNDDKPDVTIHVYQLSTVDHMHCEQDLPEGDERCQRLALNRLVIETITSDGDPLTSDLNYCNEHTLLNTTEALP